MALAHARGPFKRGERMGELMKDNNENPVPKPHVPMVSIGIATYDRNELLRETLASVLSQAEFRDFEILVGNNFVSVPVSAEAIGVSDSRIRFFNHESNLGQRGNMNFLLGEARGRFFTWLNDDDLYRGSFLKSFAEALRIHPEGRAFFSTYEIFHGEAGALSGPSGMPAISRPEPAIFLEKYLSKELLLIGCYGLFETEYLRGLGGMPVLGEGPLFYADNFLAVQAIAGGGGVLVDAPLVLFRAHDGSVSNRSQELQVYCRLQRAMFDRCGELFAGGRFAAMGQRGSFLLARWFLDDALSVALRSGRLEMGDFVNYASLVYHFAAKLWPSSYSFRVIWVFLKRLVRVALGRARARARARAHAWSRKR